MSQGTQVVVGAALVALVVGLLVGGAVGPAAAYSQGHQGEGRTGRFALVTGIRGSTPNTQTVYFVDEANEMLFTFEYNALRKKDKMELQAATDIRKYIRRGLELRAEKAKQAKKPS